MRVEQRIEAATPVVWLLTLIAAVIPSVSLLFLVRGVGERLEPGYGTAAAITLGLATILMTFATEFFSHAISTTVGFAAFCVLMREREGPSRVRRWSRLAACSPASPARFEVQAGLVGVVLARLRDRPRRLAAPRGRLRRRRARRRPADARLQHLDAGRAVEARLPRRGRRDRGLRPRRDRPQRRRLLRHHPPPPRRRRRPALRRPRAAGADADPGHGGDRGADHAALGPSGRGVDDPRRRRRLLPLRRRLLAARTVAVLPARGS